MEIRLGRKVALVALSLCLIGQTSWAEGAPKDEALPEPNWIPSIDVGFDIFEYDTKAWNKAMLKGRAADEVLDEVSLRLADDPFDDPVRLESIVMGVGTELSDRHDARVMSQAPVRVALTGSNVGLPLWEPMRILGRERTLARLAAARARLPE